MQASMRATASRSRCLADRGAARHAGAPAILWPSGGRRSILSSWRGGGAARWQYRSARWEAPSAAGLEPERLCQMAARLAATPAAAAEPDAALLWAAFWAASSAALPAFTGRQLAALLRALGSLGGEPPPADWARALAQALAASASPSPSTAVLPLAHLSPREAVDVLWGLAQLGVQPDRAAAAALLRQASANNFEGVDARAAADAAYAAAALGYRPSDAWLASIEAPLLRCADDAGSGGAHGGARGAGGVPVGLSALDAPGVGKLAWALASFGAAPSDAFLRAYALDAVYRPRFSAQAAAAVLWSLAVFEVRPEPLCAKLCYAATAAALHELPADGLANALWAVAAFEGARPDGEPSVQPPASWYEAWLAEAAAAPAEEWDRAALVRSLWALERLRLASPPALARLLARRGLALLQARAFEPLELVYLARCSAEVFAAARDATAGSSAPDDDDGGSEDAASFVKAAFDALSAAAGALPPEWVRLDTRRPPYARPPPPPPPPPDGRAPSAAAAAAAPRGAWRRPAARAGPPPPPPPASVF